MTKAETVPRSAEDLGKVAQWKDLTEQVLPALARGARWPIRLDHCFKRICLDWAFRDVWHKHLPRPAERHLEGDALRRALACAAEIASGGLPVLLERDVESLRWRGKPAKRPRPLFRGDEASSDSEKGIPLLWQKTTIAKD